VNLEDEVEKTKSYRTVMRLVETGEVCAFHGKRECFCWKFVFSGWERVHDLWGPWRGLKTPDFADKVNME
jgi:hypothetical protein